VEQQARNVYWDNYKGVLIFLVVFAHMLFALQDKYASVNYVVDFIYMFHMPAFVFVSGYFGKSEKSQGLKAIARLGMYYVIFDSIIRFSYDTGNLLEPRYSYWYLLALIVWRTTSRFLAKIDKVVIILFFITLITGFFDSIDNKFAIARVICFYVFYMMGYLLPEEKSRIIESTKYTDRVYKGILILIIMSLISVCALIMYPYNDALQQMRAYVEPMDLVARLVLVIVSLLAIWGLRNVMPAKRIPFFTMIGKNSLWIFLIHRTFTLMLKDWMLSLDEWLVYVVAAIGTVGICLLFGNDTFSEYMIRFTVAIDKILWGSAEENKKNPMKYVCILILLGYIVIAIGSFCKMKGIDPSDFLKQPKVEVAEQAKGEQTTNSRIYPVMSDEQQQSFENAVRISFVGDLILLEDQVKRAYDGENYDFSELFEYTKEHIASADLAIGVFEGPLAGEEAEYSNSNYDDGKQLWLNFPDAFAKEVKATGFDLVTTANNHVLDRGVAGEKRTIDVMDKIGLEHIGSYKNSEDKKANHIKLINAGNLKIAVLAYTYGSNNYNVDELVEGELSYVTSIISGTEGEQFELLKKSVEEDFIEAKSYQPDLIMVLPHIGTQFSTEINEEQEVWFSIFKENGADIILGDHAHIPEPIGIERAGNKNVFVAYCPGNYANIYREHNGDASMIVDVYVDKNSKEIIGGSIVPLYTRSTVNGNYQAIPIYDIMNEDTLKQSLSTDDFARAATANKCITQAAFGSAMSIYSVTDRYYFDQTGFIRSKTKGLYITDEMKRGILYKDLMQADSICFIGDSVTEGTRNGGCPWYEPIEEYLKGKNISNFSKGGCTVSYMNEHISEIPTAELYVIALGTNDIRYRDATTCAMTEQDYVYSMDMLVQKLKAKNPAAKFACVTPWYAIDGDHYSKLNQKDKEAMIIKYSEALQSYCTGESIDYINANEYIEQVLEHEVAADYLLDHIHPNSGKGVVLYSQAGLQAR